MYAYFEFIYSYLPYLEIEFTEALNLNVKEGPAQVHKLLLIQIYSGKHVFFEYSGILSTIFMSCSLRF